MGAACIQHSLKLIQRTNECPLCHIQVRIMDSNDQERERGITILSKVCGAWCRGHSGGVDALYQL